MRTQDPGFWEDAKRAEVQMKKVKELKKWIELYNENDSIKVLCDSIFAYSFDGKNVNFTVLRNCIFGDLRTEELDEAKEYAYMGQGLTQGKIRIIFGGNTDKEGVLFNNQPVILCEANHDGKFSSCDSFFKASDNLILTTLKKAEESDEYIVRLYNCEDE